MQRVWGRALEIVMMLMGLTHAWRWDHATCTMVAQERPSCLLQCYTSPQQLNAEDWLLRTGTC